MHITVSTGNAARRSSIHIQRAAAACRLSKRQPYRRPRAALCHHDKVANLNMKALLRRVSLRVGTQKRSLRRTHGPRSSWPLLLCYVSSGMLRQDGRTGSMSDRNVGCLQLLQVDLGCSCPCTRLLLVRRCLWQQGWLGSPCSPGIYGFLACTSILACFCPQQCMGLLAQVTAISPACSRSCTKSTYARACTACACNSSTCQEHYFLINS